MKQLMLQFQVSRARRYRKTGQVLAFRSDDAFAFRNARGEIQDLPPGAWVIVPLDGEGRSTGNIYGCDPEIFVATYRPACSGQPNTYEKYAPIHAYQPGEPFAVQTNVRGRIEIELAIGGPTDWIVQNPDKEVYIISNAIFRATYTLA
jgi:hypothetical protein